MMLRVYVCHAYRNDPEGNRESVKAIVRHLARDPGVLPVAPQLYLHYIIGEADQERAMRMCLALLENCQVMRVYGTVMTAGMRQELQFCAKRGIPIRWDGEPVWPDTGSSS